MEELNRAVIDELRGMARRGCTVSQMLPEVLKQLAPERPHKVTLIQYVRAAFALSLQQASPIAGWSADGPREQDGWLDRLVMPEILKNRSEWDSWNVAPSA